MAGRDADILIMGGGPAGLAAGIFLAQAGLRVTIFEAEKHPRHRVGESLLPASIPILHALGMSMEELAARFQPKFGARFYDPATDKLVTFGFEAAPGSASPSFQVLREEFDALLAAKAGQAGCELIENAVVQRFEEQGPAGVWVELGNGQRIPGRFLVDATGRAAAVAAKRREKRMISGYGRVGIYNYFTGLPPHDADDLHYITMYLFAAGWVWLIPLRDGRTSVGVVYRKAPLLAGGEEFGAKPEALFWQAARSMPRLEARLRGARETDPYRAIGDYSYTVERKFGRRWAAVGDAAGFLDPIFSSGVHLAMVSAQHAAAGIVESLETGSDARFHEYSRHMDAGYHVFRTFVQRFYQRDLVRNLFFWENKPAGVHAAITRILAGHVWDATNPVLRMLGIQNSEA